MTWLVMTGPGETAFERVFNLRPDLHDAFGEFEAQLWRTLDRDLLELCRSRIEKIHGVDGPERNATTPREAACLAFAEKFATGVHCISDEDVAAMSPYLSPPEIVALCEALAIFDGMTRFRLVLDIAA